MDYKIGAMTWESLAVELQRWRASRVRSMFLVGLGTFATVCISVPAARAGLEQVGFVRVPPLLLYSWLGTIATLPFLWLVLLPAYRWRVAICLLLVSGIMFVVQGVQSNPGTATTLELLRPALLGLLLPWCYSVGRGRLVFSRRHLTYFPLLGPALIALSLPLVIVVSRLFDAMKIPTPEFVDLAIYAGFFSAWIACAIHQIQKPVQEADPRRRLLYEQLVDLRRFEDQAIR
ncbi:MAG TPA: hypothetical protein VEH27_08830 [Methylomirabilota bacterium]|nr:hypothetical protein [Methylomirabilota bacterium]